MTDTRAVLTRAFTQDDFDSFAAVSGDNNPIHVDPEFSSRTRFGRTVAHGLLINTVLRGMLNQLAPAGQQQTQELMFPAPTYADEEMEFLVEQVSEDSFAFTVTRVADGVVTCTGKTTMAAHS